MSKISVRYDNTKDIYDQIKENLAAVSSRMPKKLEFLNCKIDDIPGPGHYTLSEVNSPLYSSKAMKFTKADRFLATQTTARTESDRQLTNYPSLISKDEGSQYFQSPQETMRLGSSIRFEEIQATEAKSNIQSKNATFYGSFSKAERKFSLKTGVENKVGPADYNVTMYSPRNRTGISFGSRLNSLACNSLSPGPGTYAPEKVIINANHKDQKGPMIPKSDTKAHELKSILKNPPLGDAYYQTSQFDNFKSKKSPRDKTFGTSPRISSLEKFQLLTPGPGTYTINKQTNNLQSTLNTKYFPSFGKPRSSRPWLNEELPGPSDYEAKQADANSKIKIKIGTSKRPGFFDPKKQIDIILNGEKLKRVKRREKVEELRAEKAEKEKIELSKWKPAPQRKLYFDQLVEKADEGPAFYDISKYNQIGSNSKGGGVMGKSERKFMKEIEDAKNTPGPGMYEVAKSDVQKSTTEVKFSTSERTSLFVNKDSLNVPGVGNYNVTSKGSSIKGGIIMSSKKESLHSKAETQEKVETFYDFIESLDDRLDKMIEIEKQKIQEDDIMS